MSMPSQIDIDGETYYRREDNSYGRAIVVVDRGWIFCGDISRVDGRIYLSRVVWIFNWQSIGLDGVIKDPKSSKVQLKKFDDVNIPESSEIYCIPVTSEWGL